jgi:ribosomal protein L37AE/L43A
VTKEDIKKSVLIGVVGGFTAAVSLLGLVWAYIEITDWYKEYQRKEAIERIESTPPDRRSGSNCPECKSADVGRYFYGLWSPAVADSATIMAVNCGLLIPGGCVFSKTNPKYKCNRCDYKWGNFVSRK